MSRVERHAIKEAEKKKTARLLRIRDCAVIFACLIMVFIYISTTSKVTPEPEYVYAGGKTKDVPVYLIGIPAEGEESDVKAVEVGQLVRGTSVKKVLGYQVVDGVSYCKVDNTGIEGAADLYMKEENLVLSPDQVVQETEVYVRTPVTIYAEETGPAIASFAPKGTCLKVTGYDTMLADGSIHKYKVEYQKGNDKTAEGYVYSKYLADTQKKADKVYKENGIYDKVKKDKYGYDLYGGKAELISRQALHCGEMRFPHPVTGEIIELKTPVPDDMKKAAPTLF